MIRCSNLDTGSGVSDQNNNVEFLNDDQLLTNKQEILTVFSYEDTVDMNVGNYQYRGKKKHTDTLCLVAEISPPVYNGNTLQASDFRKYKNKIYVSYNTRGAPFMGALQIIDVSKIQQPGLLQTVIFKNTDIHSLAVKKNNILLAGSTSESEYSTPACIEIIKLKNGLISSVEEYQSQSRRIDLPSYAATSAIKINKYLGVSVGAEDGGVVFIKFNKSIKLGYNSLTNLEYSLYPLNDARYLSKNKNITGCVKGTNGGIWIINRSEIETEGVEGELINLSGATIPESKSTLQIRNNKAYLGLGDGGAQILDLESKKVLYTIDQIHSDNSASELTVTNAVSYGYKEIFTADGEGGVRVFRINNSSVDTLAKISFGTGISINAVHYYKKHLILAAGLGGVKIVSMKRENELKSKEEDDYFDNLEIEEDEDDSEIDDD